jgi:hypothetical protein
MTSDNEACELPPVDGVSAVQQCTVTATASLMCSKMARYAAAALPSAYTAVAVVIRTYSMHSVPVVSLLHMAAAHHVSLLNAHGHLWALRLEVDGPGGDGANLLHPHAFFFDQLSLCRVDNPCKLQTVVVYPADIYTYVRREANWHG